MRYRTSDLFFFEGTHDQVNIEVAQSGKASLLKEDDVWNKL